MEDKKRSQVRDSRETINQWAGYWSKIIKKEQNILFQGLRIRTGYVWPKYLLQP
jgi:hypothetical protein